MEYDADHMSISGIGSELKGLQDLSKGNYWNATVQGLAGFGKLKAHAIQGKIIAACY